MWLAIGITALLHIVSVDKGPRWLFYITKTVPIVLMMVVAFQAESLKPTYGLFILVALAFSLIGDIFLMHPKDKFLPGLVSFLFAHLVYTACFWNETSGILNHWVPILTFSVGVIVYLLLLPSLGEMKLPVAIYCIVILNMAWAAIEYWLQTNNLSARFAVVGALIFITSDLVLAIDRFRASSGFSRHVVMVTYYTAQALLTLSATNFIYTA